MRKASILIVILAARAFAASPIVAYAISNVTTATDWTGAGAANHWASTSCAGSAGSAGATGGTGLTVLGGSAATLAAGVPGAAGKGDAIIICTGITVHVPATIGIELDKGDGSETTDAFNIRATDQTTFGSLIIDDKGLVRVHAGGASANFGSVNQYADLHVMPGGILQFGTFVSSPSTPNFNVSGRAYFGCGDQARYPMLDCSGNAGGWVTASIGTTFNFTGTLPTGLATGDRVELSPIQQPTGWVYPYTGIDGLTAPPAPPIMPTTSDTGGAAHTCGSLATCLVLPDTIFCVVATSGSSVSLGWPLGGSTWAPYCTGGEVAMAITDAGSGQLWLKKPAFMQADPAQVTWNNAISTFNSGQHSNMDAVRSTNTFGNRPISNAAGTGPGRPGDNSLILPSFTAPFTGVPTTTATSIQNVTAGNCYVDYNTARMTCGAYATGGFTALANVTYTGPIAVDLSTGFVINGQIRIPAGVRTYNELLFENVDFQGLNQNVQESTILFSALPNTATNRMEFRFNSSRMSNDILGLGTFTASASNPVEVNYNSFTDNAYSVLNNAGHIGVIGSPQYFDLSHNRIHTSKPWIVCIDQSGTNGDIAFGTITNNVMEGDTLVGGDYSVNCQWRGLLVQDNRINQTGTQETIPGNNYVGYATGVIHNSFHPEAPNRFRYNLIHGGIRGASMSANQEWDHNYLPAHWHHAFNIDAVDADNFFQTGFFGARVQNINVHHNIIVSVTSACQDSGSLNLLWIDNYTWSNNTCIGSVSPSPGFLLGDQDGGGVAMFSGLKVYNNIFFPVAGGVAAGMSKQNSEQNHMDQAQWTRAGWNSMQGTGALYAGVSDGIVPGRNPNNIPHPEFNRNVIATKAGALYNESLTRNIPGVTIQNPLYSTNQSGNIALKYNFTSLTNITMQLSNDNGASYGAPSSLISGGAGNFYTIASVTDPGSTRSFLGVTVTGTPFGNMINDYLGPFPVNSPATLYALMLPPAATAGQVFGLLPYQAPAGVSGNITFVPRANGITAGDTFVIIVTEARLTDLGGNYVDIGVDPRAIPYASVSQDTGISLTNTDYCTTGCINGPIITGLTNTFTPGGPNAPFLPIKLPLEGGSAESAFCAGQASCGGTSYFLPTGSSWKTAGFAGLPLGAVAPVVTPTFLLQ